jgi:hypothetical protein
VLGALEQGGWSCAHDIDRGRGNWDHVLVGPPGVFLLDTKSVTRAAAATRDGLSVGRIRHAGAGFRVAAAAVSGELAKRTGTGLWVQPVVVIWGEFPQRRHLENGVLYIAGNELESWLRIQPRKLPACRVQELGSLILTLDQEADPASAQTSRPGSSVRPP